MTDIDREYVGHQALALLNPMVDEAARRAEAIQTNEYLWDLHKKLYGLREHIEQLSGVKGIKPRPLQIDEINRMLARRVDTTRYMWEKDVLLDSKLVAFILCCCEIDDEDPDCWTPSAELAKAFEVWNYGGEPLTATEFGTRLRNTGTNLVSRLRHKGGSPRKGWYIRVLPEDQWRDGIDEEMLCYWPEEWVDENLWYPPQPKPADPVGETWRERAVDFLDRFVVKAEHGRLSAEDLHNTLIDQCGPTTDDKEGLDEDGQPYMPFNSKSTSGWLDTQYRKRFGGYADQGEWKGCRLVWVKFVVAPTEDDDDW